uniref:Uncharacterized protein n=1 Tax=Cacopsylla melanoneura TaxID=428564 RepID=A0A8D8ZE67_9HEMI
MPSENSDRFWGLYSPTFLCKRSTESYLSNIMPFYAPSNQTCMPHCRVCANARPFDKCLKYKYDGKNLTNKIEQLLNYYEDETSYPNDNVYERDVILSKSKEHFNREYRNHSKTRYKNENRKIVNFKDNVKSVGQQTGRGNDKTFKSGSSQTEAPLLNNGMVDTLVSTMDHACGNDQVDEAVNTTPSMDNTCLLVKTSKGTQCPDAENFYDAPCCPEKDGSSLSYSTAHSCNPATWLPVPASLLMPEQTTCKRTSKPRKLICDSRCQLLKSNIKKIHKGQEVLPQRPFYCGKRPFGVFNHPLLDRKPKKLKCKENGAKSKLRRKKNIQVVKTKDNSKIFIYANKLIGGDCNNRDKVLNKISKIQVKDIDVMKDTTRCSNPK